MTLAETEELTSLLKTKQKELSRSVNKLGEIVIEKRLMLSMRFN